MNSFIQEVITQGSLISQVSEYYRTDGLPKIVSISDVFKQKRMKKVIITGMGSSLYAANSVLSYLTAHGIPALAYSAHALSRYQFQQIDEQTLVIAISQSGRSGEVIELVKKACLVTTVVGITNHEDRELSHRVDLSLGLRAGLELSITSKTYELTMLILNILARELTGELTASFWENINSLASWISGWMDQWQTNSQPLFEFANDVLLFDLLANDTSLATAKQLSLAYREGLHNCTAVWECADYAHGQYHSSKLGKSYLAQMFIPVFETDTKEEKMLNYILDHDGRVMLYTTTPIPSRNSLFVVPLPRFENSLTPLIESPVAETMLGQLFGASWVKDH